MFFCSAMGCPVAAGHDGVLGRRFPGACAPSHKYRGRGPPETSSRGARTQETVGRPEWSVAERSPPEASSPALKKRSPVKPGMTVG